MSDTLDIDELRGAIRQVMADRGEIVIPDDRGRGLDRALWAEMAALGWLALPVGEAHGGLGLGLAHLAVLYEELGRYLASVPALETAVAAIAIERYAPDPAGRLAAIVTGECVATVAFPGDAALPVQAADGTVSGRAEHVPFADVADLLLLPALASDGRMLLGVIAADAPGVTVTARPIVDLTRSMAQVQLNGAQALWLDPGEAGWTALFDHAALGLACDSIGGGDALFERTRDYLTVREQFGRPIGSFQALKHRMADWKVRLDAARTLVRHGAAAGTSAAASGAKVYGADVYAAFAADAVQLHGGIGFTWDYPCHLFLKRAKLNQTLFGSSTLHKDRVAELVFT